MILYILSVIKKIIYLKLIELNKYDQNVKQKKGLQLSKISIKSSWIENIIFTAPVPNKKVDKA